MLVGDTAEVQVRDPCTLTVMSRVLLSSMCYILHANVNTRIQNAFLYIFVLTGITFLFHIFLFLL